MTVGGTALSTSDYTVSGMNITIPANKITGNVVITVATEKVNTQPEEYTFLSERTYNTASVPTGLYLDSKNIEYVKITCKFEYANIADSSCTKQIMFGSTDGYFAYINPTTKKIETSQGSGTHVLSVGTQYYAMMDVITTGKITYSLYSGQDSALASPIDTITRNMYTGNTITNHEIFLGNSEIASLNGYNTLRYSGIKFMEFKVYRPSGELLIDAVPAKRNSDNTYGLYNYVDNSFLPEVEIAKPAA